MATWILGDIHGCADELAELLAKADPAPEDRIVALGDLFHRGPDAAGVMDLLVERKALYLLGNHEDQVLRRMGLAPFTADGVDRPPLRTEFPPLGPADLVGDGARPLIAPAERYTDLLVFLQGHAGYYQTHETIEGAGRTFDDRPWSVVHAGLSMAKGLEGSKVTELIYPPRMKGKGRPFWYEVWEGPELMIFGHMPAPRPRRLHADGKLVALGIDTGCVYGGALTAYCPERGEVVSVDARKVYAEM